MTKTMITKGRIAKSAKKLRDAERAVEKAKLAHRAAFRRALVALFNEYGLCVEESGSEGARLEINEIRRVYNLGDLPE